MSIQKVGVINNYTVIEAVGRTLAELLVTEMENPVPVTISSPGEDYGVPVGGNGEELGTSRVNFFLYRVEEPPHSRNNDWVDVGDGKQVPYPLALNLHYMLNIFTPNKSSNLDEHLILGDVMRVFHANQIIDPIYFEGTLNPNEPPVGVPWERLQVIHRTLPLEELAAIWHAINKPYRLSVAYEVSVVTIEPPEHKSRRVRRVDVTHVKATPFRGRPVVRDISPERGYAGDLLTINGEAFESDFLKVYLNDSLIKPETTSATEITIRVPEKLPPGLYSLKVYTEEGSSEAMRFEEISPFLYRLDPDLKYTEDSDFPKDSGGEPVLTIWGGNFLTDPPTPVELLATPAGGLMTASPVAPEQLGNNSIKWVIPVNMQKGRTSLNVRQGGTRTSNAMVIEVPAPQIYRADPDTVSVLPGELIVAGDYFRDGFTELYLHPGTLSGTGDLSASEIVAITVKSESEIRTTLPDTLAGGTYQLVVRVYEKYYSESFEITVTT